MITSSSTFLYESLDYGRPKGSIKTKKEILRNIASSQRSSRRREEISPSVSKFGAVEEESNNVDPQVTGQSKKEQRGFDREWLQQLASLSKLQLQERERNLNSKEVREQQERQKLEEGTEKRMFKVETKVTHPDHLYHTEAFKRKNDPYKEVIENFRVGIIESTEKIIRRRKEQEILKENESIKPSKPTLFHNPSFDFLKSRYMDGVGKIRKEPIIDRNEFKPVLHSNEEYENIESRVYDEKLPPQAPATPPRSKKRLNEIDFECFTRLTISMSKKVKSKISSSKPSSSKPREAKSSPINLRSPKIPSAKKPTKKSPQIRSFTSKSPPKKQPKVKAPSFFSKSDAESKKAHGRSISPPKLSIKIPGQLNAPTSPAQSPLNSTSSLMPSSPYPPPLTSLKSSLATAFLSIINSVDEKRVFKLFEDKRADSLVSKVEVDNVVVGAEEIEVGRSRGLGSGCSELGNGPQGAKVTGIERAHEIEVGIEVPVKFEVLDELKEIKTKITPRKKKGWFG